MFQDDWFYDYVETIHNQGWIKGYEDGKFKPGNNISFVEVAKIVVRAFKPEIEENPEIWYQELC